MTSKDFLLTFFWFVASLSLEAGDFQFSFDSVSKRIHVEDQGEWVYVHFDTAAMKGPRIIRTEVRGPVPYAKDGTQDTVLFRYYFIQDIPRSFRTDEPITVTWKVMKINWTSWKKDKKLFLQEENVVGLSQNEIDLIKSQW